MDSTKELESPRSYFYWSLLTCISSVVSSKIWVNRGGVYNLYPNIYAFLISKKSGLGKSMPITLSKELAHDIGRVRIIDGQNSIQGVIKELQKVRTVGEGHIIKAAEGFLIAPEFGAFILSDGGNLPLTTLTDIYDTHAHLKTGYKKRLASEDEIILKSPCLVGLFASNETLFFDSISAVSQQGGFIARTFCIYEDKRNTLNSLTKDVVNRIDKERILAHLKKIAVLEGPMQVEEDALVLYDRWYHDFYGNEENENDDTTGTAERQRDNIWKAAMVLGLAHNEKKLITVYNMSEAIKESIKTFNNVKRLLSGGPKDAKSIKSMVMKTTVAMILATDPVFEIDRKLILRKGAGIFGVYDLDECIEHLLQAGMLKTDKRGGITYYKLTDLIINKHKAMKEN